MIVIRNDDVLRESTGKYKGKEFNRFRFVHEQICRAPEKLLHCPAILCQEIEAYPEAIDYIKQETKAGRMRPYLHCLNHSEDWTARSFDDIEDMLGQCDNWFSERLEYEFLVWATPWGAASEQALRAAAEIGIRLETTAETIEDKPAVRLVESTGSVDCLEGRTVLLHWWNQGLSIFRIVEVAVNGSWEAAKEARPDWF